jgi:hypothetical protein
MSRISLSGNPSGSGTLTIASPNTNSDVTINLPTVTGGNFIVSDASGNVGIGTTATPSHGVRGLAIDTTQNASAVQLGNNAGGGSAGGSLLYGSSANIFSIYTYTGAVGSETYTERLQINSAGTLVLPQGQIQFPATQNPSSNANTLDDYEEGTFAPTFIGTVSNPTVTYTGQLGQYTKVGNLVTFRIRLTISSATGGSGDLRIAGMPFTPISQDDPGFTAVVFSFNFPTNPLRAAVIGGSTQIRIDTTVSSNATTPVSELTSGGGSRFFVFGGSYFV